MIIIAGADQAYRGEYFLFSESWQDSSLCNTAGFVSMLSSEVSVLLVALISIDRVLCVVFPFHQDIHMTPTSSHILIAGTWVLAFVLSLVPILVPEYSGEFYGQSSVCLGLPLTSTRPSGWEYSIFIFLGLNFFSFVIILICYVMIFITVQRSASKMRSRMQTAQSTKMSAQIKLASKMALIVGTDFCCWMPIIIMGKSSALTLFSNSSHTPHLG